MPTFVDLRTPLSADPPPQLLAGYGDLAIEVSDLARARGFYADLLGFAPAGETPEGPRLAISQDQGLVLVQRETPRAFLDSGIHQAYRFPADALSDVEARLAAAGVEVLRYHEDHPAEREQNRYCVDPDGNRVQLVAGAERGVDHVALETHDLEWSEVYYTHLLGGRVVSRVGWHMDDYVRATAWGEGAEDSAPGTRRWDRRYTSMEGKRRVARPNAHFFVRFEPATVLGVYLATEHRQEPPPRQLIGTPRVGFRVVAGSLDALEQRFRELRLRCLPASRESGGPFVRQGDAIFARDPAGNFLHFHA